MAKTQITAPEALPLTLAQIKDHLRITADAEDDQLEALARAAVQMIESDTSLALITQTWRIWLDELPLGSIVELPRNPVQRITNVIWFDEAGAPITIGGNAYLLNSVTKPARLKFDKSACPPGRCNGIEIDFEAGFGDIGLDVPDTLKRATLALIAHWYEFRGVYSASDQPVSVPEVYTRLTRHYRQVRL